MVGVTGTDTFLFMWIGFLALMLGGLTLILVWAIRTHQFSHQDRARYLPLRSGIPKAPREEGHGEGNGGKGAQQ